MCDYLVSEKGFIRTSVFRENENLSDFFRDSNFCFRRISAAYRAGRGPLGSSSVCVGVRGCASACLRSVDITVGPFVVQSVCGC